MKRIMADVTIMLGKDDSLGERLPEEVVRLTFIRKEASSCLNKM